MTKNILNNREYAKMYENKVLRMKRLEKIDMQEIEWLLDSLEVNDMLEFYRTYGIIPNKNAALIFKVNFYDFFAYRYLNFFFCYPYQCLSEYTRSSKCKDIEFYEILRQLYDSNDYDTFNYLASILEFTSSDNIIDAFTPYLITNRLSK